MGMDTGSTDQSEQSFEETAGIAGTIARQCFDFSSLSSPVFDLVADASAHLSPHFGLICLGPRKAVRYHL